MFDMKNGEYIDKPGKGRVIVLATGGTIAGVGDDGKTAGYAPGALGVSELIKTVPQISSVANIETIQVCNVNSDDITSDIWIGMARTINALSKVPDVSGFVITHGTDTLEETAYFLNLTVRTEKPVVITGSMRPSTSISPDGPMNLYQAVSVACSPEARGHGVLVVFSDGIYAAGSVIKTSTYRVSAISAGYTGALGVIRDDRVFLYNTPDKIHTVNSGFDISGISSLPRVPIIYFSVDADPDMLRYAASRSDGIVIAGAGAGEFSGAFKEVIGSLSLPVVISSRIDDGIIIPENLLCKNTVASYNLSPQKAAILLRLALTKTKDREKIQELFAKY